MSEKRVSVRLVMQGGKKVQAEFTKVGKEAEKSGRSIKKGMSEANQALSRFAKRATVVGAAAVSALSGLAAMAVDRGLEVIDAQAKLAQSLDTSVASIQTLARAGELAGVAMSGIEQATKDMTRRLSQAATGTGPAIDALNRLGLSAENLMGMALDDRVAAVSDAMEKFIPAAERAAVAGQIFGEEGSIAMGRISADTIRQANEELDRYGLLLSDVDAAGVERANDALSKIGMIWTGMGNSLAAKVAPTLERIANGLAASLAPDGTIGKALTFLGDNIDRAFAYATSFAAFLAGKWVFSMVRAALSVKGLARALVLFKGALIATGVGALIVGAGELVLMFTKLVRGAGGFGSALSLLKDLAADVWARMKVGASSLESRHKALWHYFKADSMEAMQSGVDAATAFANNVINSFEGAKNGIVAIWQQLPQLLGNAIYSSANGVIGGVESLLNGVIDRVNYFYEKMNAGIDFLPDWAQADWMKFDPIENIAMDRITNPFEGAGSEAAEAIKAAFKSAFDDDYFTAPDLGFAASIFENLDQGNQEFERAERLAKAMLAPIESWQALRDAVKSSDELGSNALGQATVSAKLFEDALAAAAGVTTKAGDKVFKGWEAVNEKLKDYAKTAAAWGGSLGDVLVGTFQGAESAFRSFITTGKGDFKSLVHSMLADLAVLQFRKAVLGPVASALGLALPGAAAAVSVAHTGGMIGSDNLATRVVDPAIFAKADRYHGGGWPGLAPNEVPIIAERGERVLSRSEVARGGAGRDLVEVQISVADDGKLVAMVNRTSGNVAATVVGAALEEYDAEVLPGRVNEIGKNPWKVG